MMVFPRVLKSYIDGVLIVWDVLDLFKNKNNGGIVLSFICLCFMAVSGERLWKLLTQDKTLNTNALKRQ